MMPGPDRLDQSINSRRAAGRLPVVLLLAASIVAGCSSSSGVKTVGVDGASSDVETTSSSATGSADPEGAADGLGGAALEAARFGQPGLLLDHAATDSTLDQVGHLLVGPSDLGTSYAEGSEWCQSRSATCVEVSGDDDLEFGGLPLDDFVLVAESDVSGGGDLSVADVQVVQHPVSGLLRMSVDVSGSELGWSSAYDQPLLTIGDTEHEIYLDGPSVTEPGHVTRFEVTGADLVLDGPVELTVPFSDGVQDGRVVELTVRVDDPGPTVDRRETPIDANPPVELFRSESDLTDGDDSDVLDALVQAIVGGGDAVALVAEGSPAATAVATIGDVAAVVDVRRDPDRSAAVCWQIFGRGTFCERWHDPVVVDDLITSWSIEGNELAALVDTRAGSLSGSESRWLRLPLGRLVLGSMMIRNAATTDLYLDLYAPTVIAGGLATAPLRADGDYVIEAEATGTSVTVISADDLDFDISFPDRYEADAAPVEFSADAPEPEVVDDATAAQETAAIRLASLIGESRVAEAEAMVAPDTDAFTYVSSLGSTLSESFAFTSRPDGSVSPAGVCLNSGGSRACAQLTVEELDDDGLIRALSVDGTDVADLVVDERSVDVDGFGLSVDSAIVWPGLMTVVVWSVANDTDSVVYFDTLVMVDTEGVLTEPSRGSVYEELPGGRTVGGMATFPGDQLDGAFEISGDGREDVRELVLVLPLSDEFVGVESSVEYEATTTDVETRGGTVVTLPGDWSQYVVFDEDAGQLAGEGTPFGPPKSVTRRGAVLMAFSPETSPFDLTSDELVAGLDPLLVVTEVESYAATTADGRPTVLLSGEADFIDQPSTFFAVPAQDDVYVLVVPTTVDEDPIYFSDTLIALAEQAGVTEN